MYAYVTIRLFIVLTAHYDVKSQSFNRSYGPVHTPATWKHVNEHHVVHDYGLWAMVKITQDGDLKMARWSK